MGLPTVVGRGKRPLPGGAEGMGALTSEAARDAQGRAPGLKLVVLGGGAVVSEYYLEALGRLGLLEQAVVVDPSAQALAQLVQREPRVRVRQAGFEEVLDSARADDGF